MPNNSRHVLRQARRAETAIETATRRAINKMGAQSNTQTVRQLSRAIGLPQSRIRDYVSLRRANYSSLQASVRILRHEFNVASFPGTRQTKTGKALFSYTRAGRKRTIRQKGGGIWARAWGTAKFYRGGFLIQGGKTAMHRVGKSRLPIRPIFGPGTTREFLRNNLPEELSLMVSTRMPGTMKHELAFVLGRIGMRAR